jgi:hypothetical protein
MTAAMTRFAAMRGPGGGTREPDGGRFRAVVIRARRPLNIGSKTSQYIVMFDASEYISRAGIALYKQYKMSLSRIRLLTPPVFQTRWVAALAPRPWPDTFDRSCHLHFGAVPTEIADQDTADTSPHFYQCRYDEDIPDIGRLPPVPVASLPWWRLLTYSRRGAVADAGRLPPSRQSKRRWMAGSSGRSARGRGRRTGPSGGATGDCRKPGKRRRVAQRDRQKIVGRDIRRATV